MSPTFAPIFRATTGNIPYDYQRRLAGGDIGHPCDSQLIAIPTGLEMPGTTNLRT